MKNIIRLILVDSPIKKYRRATVSKFQIAIVNETKNIFDKFRKIAPRGYKKVVKEIPKILWNINISTRLSSTYGMAACIMRKKKVAEVDLTFSIDMMKNKSKRLFREIISHELSHGIDFILRNGDSFHDEPWRHIHRMLGGTGRTFIY